MTDVKAVAGDGHQTPRKWYARWRVAAAVAAVAVLAAAATLVVLHSRMPKPAGNELAEAEPYGWHAAKDVGTVFTDGLNLVTVSDGARGALRLVSAKPLMDGGGTLRVLGVLARVNPDMLPPGHTTGWFQDSPGFPPSRHDDAGGVDVKSLVVRPPATGEDRWIEIQIGYEVIAEGRSARRGVELIYEYEGETKRAFIPSYLAICAPATASCEPEYDD
ncbi:hypothetical protein [Micromonospora sp. NPDC051296]|uniref:hypothetical protein n=1 Tax=Micromonospora sp. NPDC051296 TaxID=3155046 RepID=UPI00343B1014